MHGQEVVIKPYVVQLVDSVEATEDVVEAYPVLARLTAAQLTRPGAGIVMSNRSNSDDWASSGNGRRSDSISSMVIPADTFPLARKASAAEVKGAAARFSNSSRARDRKAAAAARDARPRRGGSEDQSAQSDEKCKCASARAPTCCPAGSAPP